MHHVSSRCPGSGDYPLHRGCGTQLHRGSPQRGARWRTGVLEWACSDTAGCDKLASRPPCDTLAEAPMPNNPPAAPIPRRAILLLGLLTPPLGLLLNVTASISKSSMEKLSIVVLPFLAVEVGVLMLIAFVKPVSMWLPRLLGYG